MINAYLVLNVSYFGGAMTLSIMTFNTIR